ncbi:hypothetical protein E8E12_006488 [Didymella heteroderae]|uniref:Nephrocystin 3-like N-terminal domain-containing protein n=1 Tax=Didymella heteroderae TaxID=1769908 RepID=A0A9P4WN24_9PLEO|nr:hypothetical protein E8E12_006488 [Didymella heteroderae]
MKHAFRSMAAQSPNDLTVSYFIHGQGSDLQKTPLGVFRALLNSLLGYFPARLTKATATFTDREKRFGGYTDGRWTWTCKELQELLLETLLDNLHDRRITIFIDALDECGEVPARDLLDYFSNLSRKAEEQAVDIRLCLSSRHYPVLGLDECPTISVEQKNTEDVEWYVKDRLRSIGSLPKRKRLQDELLTKASGGFQWVYLVTEALIIRNLTGKSLVGAVASCPQSLGAMYAALLSTESEEEDRQTIKLLLWVLLAERRLSAQELREAVATSPHMACTSVAQLRSHEDWSENLTDFERYVKHVSRGLIEFRTRDFWEQWEDSDREAQFVHQSVADFLRDSNAINKEQGTTGAGHFQISRSCLKYLTMGEILSEQGLTRDQLSSRFPLAPYAVRYVFAHIKKAEEAGLAQTDLLSVVKWPSEPETAHRLRSMWEKLNHTNAGTPPGWPFLDTPVLQVLAALGSKSAFFAALKEDVGAINKKDSDGNTPLHIAIALGHYDIALELLRQFHEKQQQDRSENDSEASGNAVRFLDIDAKNNEGETALDTAVAMKAEVVLTRLISLGANLKRLGQPHLLVRHAINNGDTELLATLIAGDIDLVGAVYFAIENSLSADIVQALAEGGGDINRLVIHEADNSDEDDYDDYERVEFRQTGGNALHLACRRGLDAEVRILLTNGASPSARDLNGQCPLHIAVAFQSYYNAERTCSLETIACLLEYEPTAVEIEDYGGRSPLTALVQNFDASELEERKDLEVLGNLFLTKAQFSTPSVALTKLLLEYHEFWDLLGVEALETAALLSITKSLDIAAKNKRGQSIMWLAANRGFAALVDGLLARDSVDVNEVDDFATSPLLAAISRRHLAVVQSLLAVEGIDVNARNKLGRSPLHVAVEHETAEAQEVDVDHDIVALLFAARGIDIDAEDEHGLSPLVAAAESGCRVCVTRLLDAIGTDSDAPKNQVAYAHFAAMLADKREIAEMLAEFDRNGSSVLYTAVRTGSLDVVKRLVQQDNLKINVVDEEGNSPLRLAAEQHDKSIFKVLVDERRTNPDIEDGQGRSLLSWAAEVGNVTVVMTLLNTKRVNVNHLDPAGLTPLDKAQQNGHRMIAAILQAFTSGAQQMPYRVQHISYRGLSPALNDLDRYLDSL